MELQLFPYKILIYYDLPELFLAKDNIETKYICLRTPDEVKPSYVSLPVSNKKLHDIQIGSIDLRNAFAKSEMGYWLISNFIDDAYLLSNRMDWSSLPNELLPEEGYFLEKPTDIDPVMIRESNEKYNTILHLSLSDRPGEESIQIDILSDFIKSFQNLIKYTYKKEISQFRKPIRETLDQPGNYLMRAFAASPGSFNLHLEATTTPNLFGENNIERALEKVDLMFNEYGTEEEVIDILRGFKGHSVNNFRKILELILRDNIHFEYKWVSQSNIKIKRKTINPIYAYKLIELLKTKNDLSQEIREFIGYVHQADVDKGNWRIVNIEDNKEYSGISELTKLEGITLETVKYKFTCEEVIEEYKVSGKEEIKYKLISFESTE